MPGSLLQAPSGGTCPRTIKSFIVSNELKFEEKVEAEDKDRGEEMTTTKWVKGCKEEDNMRYRELLKYMEDKRTEARERLAQDEGRKKETKQMEDSWALLRLSMNFLKENEGGWRQRRIEECDKIRDEEKRDRLAVVREKKKRYGLKRLSKEENRRKGSGRRRT